jgi:hypothetical protein
LKDPHPVLFCFILTSLYSPSAPCCGPIEAAGSPIHTKRWKPSHRFAEFARPRGWCSELEKNGYFQCIGLTNGKPGRQEMSRKS